MNAPLLAAAADELHDTLSEWAHATKPPQFIVRRMLPGSSRIVVDIVGPKSSSIDRFVLNCRACEEDAARIAISVTAGTLTTTKQETAVRSLAGVQRWMNQIAKVCNL
jgi:hypothetical protein